MSFPRYPKYKASGVKWLGDVPDHWEILQSRRVFSLRTERARTDDEQLTASQKHGVIPQKLFMELEDQRVVQVLLNAEILKHVEPGDFVISMRSFQGGIEYATHGGCISSAYVMLIPSAMVRGGFFKYLFKSLTYIQALQSTTNLVRDGQALRFQNFSLVPLPHVPPDEQSKIASFLDRETSKIDGLVGEQRRLIELLKEKRQAVISHAVTKGLNPHAPLKPSGIEWLGDVPEHWEVRRLKYAITKIEQGWSPQCDNEPAVDGEWGVLKVGCGNRDEFDPTEQKALPLELVPLPEYEIKPGDILMSRGNTRDLVGMATLVKQVRPRLLLCDLLYRFHAQDQRVEPEFLVFSLRSANVRFQIEREATGTSASMKKIGQGTIREFVICLPPLDEQREIVSFINAETAKLDALTAEAERGIELLQERRTALISAAVTGQIDVRGLVTP